MTLFLRYLEAHSVHMEQNQKIYNYLYMIFIIGPLTPISICWVYGIPFGQTPHSDSVDMFTQFFGGGIKESRVMLVSIEKHFEKPDLTLGTAGTM